MSHDDEIDRRIDEQLRAAFAPPPQEQLAAHARRVTEQAPRRPFWPWLVAAAAVLVVVVIAATRGPRLGPQGHDGAALGALWASAFEDAIARGFEGPACCQPGVDLPSACQAMFDTRLELQGGDDVELCGCYCGLPTGGCMALLTKADDSPVCVYVVPKANDPHVELPPGSKLRLARRELGDLTLYALSTDPAPSALERFVVPVE